jgi:hypothetical protein
MQIIFGLFAISTWLRECRNYAIEKHKLIIKLYRDKIRGEVNSRPSHEENTSNL